MDVGSRMKVPVITIDADESMRLAAQLLERHHIRQLPVVSKGRLVGIVSDRDIRRHSASRATSLEVHELNYLLERIKVRDIMTPEPVTVTPTSSIEEAATLLRDRKFGALPVVEGERVVGIITATDILDLLIEVLGMRQPGGLIELVVEDRPGSIYEVGRVVQEHGADIVSIMTSMSRDDKRVLLVKVDTMEFEEIAKDLEAVGIHVLSALV
ncbi:MAG: CBS domain-containing protein [Candidatus Tectomicrobia bacterium]|nr:CBS domain-containing protein [Candidatus Tectomicrobia bacterium]